MKEILQADYKKYIDFCLLLECCNDFNFFFIILFKWRVPRQFHECNNFSDFYHYEEDTVPDPDPAKVR